MKMFGFPFKTRKVRSAGTAKERLQILLAHERSGGSDPDYQLQLQREIMDVIKRHMEIDKDAIDIRMERSDDLSSLEINIDLPGGRT